MFKQKQKTAAKNTATQNEVSKEGEKPSYIAPKPDFPNILDVQEEFKEWKRKGFLWQKRSLPEGIEVGSNINLSYARIEDLTQDAQGSNGYMYIAMQEPSVGFVVRSGGVVEEVQETVTQEVHKPFTEE